ncbi:sulfonate ABC transporter substrate-binding protein [Neobacillus ginsengisoli]|uniref:Sulfonate transport system substrate-binding protein n=1 Tax=Neobacillus ginsengisoli TaxID=904295 RepID=A0ABT9Y131_9BACI|nr:sulfonate ABC transporter substrate-binding protein [Neobacillus ginsengisoli]MDQ0201520.1 sulfonate transport system substrate-binding protein [Neobacillus ginsengisoli]
MIKKYKRNWWVAFILLLSFLLSGCSTSTSGEKQESASNTKELKVINIGYQKFGTLNILKAKGSLEKGLKPLGYSVKWTEFPGGPQLLEALNVGSLDFGHTGEAPPIFAQAAGAPLVYYADASANPKGEAILVPKNSPIKTLKDLKGKKIALNKGSNVHFLLVKILEKAGIPYGDIKTVFLPPADARAAFEKGSVDAWVIWDPFLADAERATNARILADGTGLVNNREFFLATSKFEKENPKVLDVIFKELKKTDKWVEGNPKEAAKFLAPQIGMSVDTLELTLNRRTFGLEKMNKKVAKDQQQIADAFYKLKLIPKDIQVQEAISK